MKLYLDSAHSCLGVLHPTMHLGMRSYWVGGLGSAWGFMSYLTIFQLDDDDIGWVHIYHLLALRMHDAVNGETDG